MKNNGHFDSSFTSSFTFSSHGNKERVGIVNTTTLIRNVGLPLMDWSNRAASNTIWNLLFSFKFLSVFASVINLTETTSSQAQIPRSIPWLQTSQGKEKPVAKSRAGTSHGEFMPSSRVHHLPASALLPRWRSLIYLCKYQNQLEIPWGCPKLCSAAWGCFLPSSQASPCRKRLWGMWGRERWGAGSTCSSTPPAAVNALTCSVFEIAICPCPKGAANCTNVFRN